MLRTFLLIGFLLCFIFLLAPEAANAQGLVACGGADQNPCQLCDIFKLVKNILDIFIFPFVPIIGALLLAVGGFFMFIGGANPQWLSRGKSILIATIVGLIIVYTAWLVINTFFTFFGVASWVGPGGGWWEIDCAIPTAPISVPPPIAHWDFNEGSGTFINDSSRSNDGVLSLGTAGNTSLASAWVAGQFGNAILFDDVDDFVEVPNAGGIFDLTAAWTIAAWVMPLSSGWDLRNDPIVWKIAASGLNEDTFTLGWGGHNSPGVPVGNLFSASLERASDAVDFIVFSPTYSISQWHHVVGTYDGNNIHIYVDGAPATNSVYKNTLLISNPIGPIAVYTGSEPLRIGNILNSNHGNAGVFNGIIDDVKIWTVGLTPSQVAKEFADTP